MANWFLILSKVTYKWGTIQEQMYEKNLYKVPHKYVPFEEQHKIPVETSFVQCLELQDTINVQVRAWKRIKRT